MTSDVRMFEVPSRSPSVEKMPKWQKQQLNDTAECIAKSNTRFTNPRSEKILRQLRPDRIPMTSARRAEQEIIKFHQRNEKNQKDKVEKDLKKAIDEEEFMKRNQIHSKKRSISKQQFEAMYDHKLKQYQNKKIVSAHRINSLI